MHGRWMSGCWRSGCLTSGCLMRHGRLMRHGCLRHVRLMRHERSASAPQRQNLHVQTVCMSTNPTLHSYTHPQRPAEDMRSAKSLNVYHDACREAHFSDRCISFIEQSVPFCAIRALLRDAHTGCARSYG